MMVNGPDAVLPSAFKWYEMTVLHRDDAVHLPGQIMIVSCEKCGQSRLANERLECLKHIGRCFGIEIARWFIGEQDQRSVGDSARDGHALLLTA